MKKVGGIKNIVTDDYTNKEIKITHGKLKQSKKTFSDVLF